VPGRPEKTQRGNPHELTVRQHVFPARSIARFTEGGVVDLYDLIRGKGRPARPDDDAFCAARAWSHGAEHGFMKEIEDAFQKLVGPISPVDRPEFDRGQTEVISEFYGLWSARAQWRRLPQQTIKPSAEILGTRVDYTEDDLELLERNSIGAFRPDGSIAMRDIAAIRIRVDVDRTRDSMAGRQWGVLTAADGEFCVPDTPKLAIIPISPVMILAADGPSEPVDRLEVEHINRELRSGAREYVFARSLAACPGLPPLPRSSDP
jgi:hypothetical protein